MFVFDKKSLDKLNPFGKGSRSDFHWFQSLLISEVKQLSKLRHPSILRVVETLVELKDTGVAFAAEPIIANLTLLNAQEMDDIEIQSGILQLLKGLQFLHDNQIAHCCLLPSSVFVDSEGNWKIGGFTLSQSIGSRVFLDIPPIAQPYLCYLAPELLSDQPVTWATDVFSLGSLIYSIYNQGSPVTSTSGTQMYLEEVKAGLKVANLPLSLQGIVQQMLSFDPEFRPNISTIMTCDFFNNSLIGTIKILDGFLELNVIQKAQFLKNLPTQLQQFSLTTVVKKILPQLLSELKNSELAPFLLPPIVWICDRITDAEFRSKIIPVFKTTVFIIKEPPQANLLILSRADLFVKKLTDGQFKTEILPFIVQTLSSSNEKVLIGGTKAITKTVSHLDFLSLKSEILPKLFLLFKNCKSVAIQGNILVAISSFISKLDQQSCIHDLLPFLGKITEPPELLILVIAKLYKDICLVLDAVQVSAKILPSLWILSSTCATIKQFNQITAYIEEITTWVKKNRKGLVERTSKEELRSISSQKPITPHSSNPLIPSRPTSTASTKSGSSVQDIFSMTTPPRPNSILSPSPRASTFNISPKRPTSTGGKPGLTKEDLSRFESM